MFFSRALGLGASKALAASGSCFSLSTASGFASIRCASSALGGGFSNEHRQKQQHQQQQQQQHNPLIKCTSSGSSNTHLMSSSSPSSSLTTAASTLFRGHHATSSLFSRYLSTSSTPRRPSPSTQQPKPAEGASSGGISSFNPLKKTVDFVKTYGVAGIVTYWSLYLGCVGIFYSAIMAGVDTTPVVDFVKRMLEGIYEVPEVAETYRNIAIAILLTEVLEPVRLAMTFALAPRVKNLLKRK